MAIDDPVGIVIRQADEELNAETYLPIRLSKLGLSFATAVALAKLPFVSQIVTTLVTSSPIRFEERLLRVAEELNEQQKRIEDKIPDRSYYESEEFQTLMGLLIERLHTTHDGEKLKMFGDALANSGSRDFAKDRREEFVRILRDLSLADIQELRTFAPRPERELADALDDAQRFRLCPSQRDLKNESLSRTTRLIGLGLVTEELKLRNFTGGVVFRSESDLLKAMRDYIQQPPAREYRISWFGWRFLQFITEAPPLGSSTVRKATPQTDCP
jgi:hypothetical protein